jgi:FlaA1/EpsC-like NDP-sugar epimerase
LFQEQIKIGGPITVTHEKIIRYFMTIPEAAQLVIQAGGMARGGDVFVLDMGEPVKIIDLAKRMIRLAGMKLKGEESAEGDIEIKIVGLRPGEKLYEELLIGDNVTSTSHPKIKRAEEELLPWEEVEGLLRSLKVASKDYKFDRIRTLLQRAVKDYMPQQNNVVVLDVDINNQKRTVS